MTPCTQSDIETKARSGRTRLRIGRVVGGSAALIGAAWMAAGASAQEIERLEPGTDPGPAAGVSTLQGALSVSAQVSVVFEAGERVAVMRTNFADVPTGADATPAYVMRSIQEAAIAGLGEAARNGAQTGHADVVAVVYQFAGTPEAVAAWRPLGVFINTTDMSRDPLGQTQFHTRVQFIPDNSRQAAGQGAQAYRQDNLSDPPIEHAAPATPQFSWRF
jgi:hypothetical protein